MNRAQEMSEAIANLHREQAQWERPAVLIVSEECWKGLLQQMEPDLRCFVGGRVARWEGIPVIVSPHYEGPPLPLPKSLFESHGLTSPTEIQPFKARWP